MFVLSNGGVLMDRKKIIELYKAEMNILKQEQALLDKRKDLCFKRFIERSENIREKENESNYGIYPHGNAF